MPPESKRSRPGPSPPAVHVRSRRLSWQPSHEANFQTASRGLRLVAISYLPFAKEALNLIHAKDRAVAADKVWSILAVSAHGRAALHVTLQRKIGLLRADAALVQRLHGISIITSGPQISATAFCGSNGCAESAPSPAHVAVPVAGGAIDRDENLQVEARAPAFQFSAEEHVPGVRAP